MQALDRAAILTLHVGRPVLIEWVLVAFQAEGNVRL